MTTKQPRLRIIKPTFTLEEQTIDFEKAKDITYNGEYYIFAEGELVRSFEELQRIAGDDRNKDKEIITLRFLEVVGGG